MDIYLPDEFYALSELPNARRTSASSGDHGDWLGGEAFVTPAAANARQTPTEPDPIWLVV